MNGARVGAAHPEAGGFPAEEGRQAAGEGLAWAAGGAAAAEAGSAERGWCPAAPRRRRSPSRRVSERGCPPGPAGDCAVRVPA